MKKRIVCALLTLIMLVSLVNSAALTAFAASAGTSEGAITVLKKMCLKKDYCEQLNKTQTFITGYGTVCKEPGHQVDNKGNLGDGTQGEKHQKHYISEKQADEALRTALGQIDQKVDSFASANGLKLTQAQNDALNIFSFIYGTEWMNGTGNLKTLLKTKPGYADLVNAMKTVGNNNDDRCGVFANMYLNGVYSNNLPTNYVNVEYNPNGGIIAQTTVPGAAYASMYNPSISTAHLVSATRSGYTFLGWFDGSKHYTPRLPNGTSAVSLTALWQKNGTEYSKAETVSYIVKKDQLSSTVVFTAPINEAKYILKNNDAKKTDAHVTTLESYKNLNEYAIEKVYADASGNKWVKLSGVEYWLMLSGTVASTGSDQFSTPSINVTVTVTNAYVNARQSATAGSALVGTYKVGQQLRIINTTVNNGITWGQVAKSDADDTPVSWVCLMYTNWGEVGKDVNPSTNTNAIATATVSASSYVNVRSGAGTENQIVGSLKKGDSVGLYEIKTVNGHQWGRADQGWFCLTYANVTMKNGSTVGVNVSDAGALAYAFAGKTSETVTAYVAASKTVDVVGTVEANTDVTVTNMTVDAQGSTWIKITWKTVENKKEVLKSGWVVMSNGLSTASARVKMSSEAEFKVISSLTVRERVGSDQKALFTMNPGVVIRVKEIKIVGETLWGLTYSYSNVNENVNEADQEGWVKEGWVNLATKYVTRTNAPSVPTVTNSTGDIATIVGVDSVNVRIDSSIHANKIGSLRRGTTAEILEVKDGWYKLDIDVDKNPETDSWVYKDYVQVSKKSTGTSSGGATVVANPDGTTTTTSTVGTGIVANTYSGVNVRSGAGVGYAQVTKLLPGTSVEILETTTVGTEKWGRCAQGWVSMNYITMISSTTTTTTATSGNGTPVTSFDDIKTSSLTAIYTGRVNGDDGDVKVYKAPNLGSEIVSKLKKGSPITMHELVTATEIKNAVDTQGKNENTNIGGTVQTTTETTYWARVNDGYIYNPRANITLDALDEKPYTLTGSDTLNVRAGAGTSSDILGQLKKGDQVKVTALKIDYNYVWGQISYDETEAAGNAGKIGWIRLDYMAEGAYFVQKSTTSTTTQNFPNNVQKPTIGSTGNTTTVPGTASATSYRYTGKVVNTNQLNVRQTASTSAGVTTTLKNGQALVIYETTISEAMAWGRCDAGWVYLYYVDLVPATAGVVDARVVYNDNTVIYSDANGSSTVGTYARMSVVDIYEIVDKMARTDLGWIHTDNLL